MRVAAIITAMLIAHNVYAEPSPRDTDDQDSQLSETARRAKLARLGVEIAKTQKDLDTLESANEKASADGKACLQIHGRDEAIVRDYRRCIPLMEPKPTATRTPNECTYLSTLLYSWNQAFNTAPELPRVTHESEPILHLLYFSVPNIVRDERDRGYRIDMESPTPNIDAFLRSGMDPFQRPTGGSPDADAEYRKAWAAAKTEAEKLDVDKLQKTFSGLREKACAPWTAIETQASLLIAARKKVLEPLQAEATKIGELLDEDARAKEKKDTGLSYAIYGMIVVLPLMFLISRFFGAEIQAEIFRNRSLVEMIGLAFLLLTIIVLGTGDRIDRPVLGTLLGSIGGYIFGTQARSERRDSPGKQTGAPPSPPAATFAIPDGTSSSAPLTARSVPVAPEIAVPAPSTPSAVPASDEP